MVLLHFLLCVQNKGSSLWLTGSNISQSYVWTTCCPVFLCLTSWGFILCTWGSMPSKTLGEMPVQIWGLHFGTALLVLWSTHLICLSFPVLWVLCLTHDSAVLYLYSPSLGFPGGSTGKECTCNTEDPSLIPGSERFPEDEIGYPLQFSWVSLVAQRVKNLPVMRETWVWSLGWKDPLEKGIVICVGIYIYFFFLFFFFFTKRDHTGYTACS